jgi:hypothetical protein
LLTLLKKSKNVLKIKLSSKDASLNWHPFLLSAPAKIDQFAAWAKKFAEWKLKLAQDHHTNIANSTCVKALTTRAQPSLCENRADRPKALNVCIFNPMKNK